MTDPRPDLGGREAFETSPAIDRVPAETPRNAGWSKLAERVLTSAVLLGVTALILFRGGPFLFSLEVTLFVALALHEFLQLLKKDGVPVSTHFGLATGIVIPLAVYTEFGLTQSGEILFLVLGCLFLFVLKFFRNNPQSLVGISLTLFGVLYISWFLSFLIKIRFLPGGVLWVAYLIAVTKAADIGAYIIGTAFGRHTFAPHISPKKSVEGLVGGLAASLAASVAFQPYLPAHFSVAHAAVLGLLIGTLGQIGDLSESLLKRFCHAKDSGGLLPGMGGVMDAVDSILFTAPILYFHLKVYL